MKFILLFVVMGLSACNVKLNGGEANAPAPKPVTCARGLNREVPQAFQSLGTPVGAVRTEACDTLVIGTNPQGETILAKYDSKGNPDELFGDRAVSKPLQGRYGALNVRIQRIAVVNNGYFALGTYGRANDAKALFVFRFMDTGFLDLTYGPLRDGVGRANADPGFNLLTVGAPVIEGEQMRLRNRGEDVNRGVETEREQVVLAAGTQTMGKDLQAVPVSCELLNHDSLKQGTQVQIGQSACGELSFRSNGPFGNDALSVVVNGTSYYSNLLGEMRWYYEGRTMVLVSRDGLGFVKKEFVNFVQGQTMICGAPVDARRRYLVFSPKTPVSPDWLSNCWYL